MNTATSQFAGATPGPWVVHGELETLVVVSVNSDSPNACDGVRQVCAVKCGDYELPDYREHEANARLIAAAPSLLRERDQLREALRLMLAYVETCGQDYPLGLTDDARAALAAGGGGK